MLTWDEKETAEAAQGRLDALLTRLEALGAPSTGEIGLSDPVAAVAEVIAREPVDEIILSTLPPGISRWLGQDVASRLRAKATVPVAVVTVPREAATQQA
jgi:nucleotide-binding universal stress UspA family protein